MLLPIRINEHLVRGAYSGWWIAVCQKCEWVGDGRKTKAWAERDWNAHRHKRPSPKPGVGK